MDSCNEIMCRANESFGGQGPGSKNILCACTYPVTLTGHGQSRVIGSGPSRCDLSNRTSAVQGRGRSGAKDHHRLSHDQLELALVFLSCTRARIRTVEMPVRSTSTRTPQIRGGDLHVLILPCWLDLREPPVEARDSEKRQTAGYYIARIPCTSRNRIADAVPVDDLQRSAQFLLVVKWIESEKQLVNPGAHLLGPRSHVSLGIAVGAMGVAAIALPIRFSRWGTEACRESP